MDQEQLKSMQEFYDLCSKGIEPPNLILTTVGTVHEVFMKNKDYRAWREFRLREVENGFLYLNPYRLP